VRDKTEIGIVTGSVGIEHDDSESCRRDETCTRGSSLSVSETVSSGDIDNGIGPMRLTFDGVLDGEKCICEWVETLI
jgi:hypothetical protein